MKPSSFFASFAGVTALSLVFAAGLRAQSPAAQATPPPTPPPLGVPATPLPNATLVPLGAPAGAPASPSPSPPPSNRKGLDGVWEVAIQRTNSTDYTHFQLAQDGDNLRGTYLDARGKRYPLVGNVDGQSVRIIVTLPNGTTLLLEGRLDGTTDMIGMLTMPDGAVPFTAAYRPKEKWIENVNPSPGGINPGNGGYTPP
ncbi:MAG: hypothetical protein JO263_09390 [Candidatus Eremiobacteraeota bacterium]|nr:hypothetical protein [Candidatus Eremiobacteraeota bacterium]